MTKYLGTFCYNLISISCQFLMMAFINRNTALVGIAIFKAR